MRSSKIALAVVAFMLILGAGDAAETPAKKIRILGIGNSFTMNATRFLPQIIASDKSISADVGVACIGGCSLERHVGFAKLAEKKPEAKQYCSYHLNGKELERGVSLKHILQQQKWDYVTIQQVSHESRKKESFYPYARELYDYVKKYCPDAKVVVHETWAHRIDCPRTAKWKLPPKEMYKLLHANYTNIAKELNTSLIPVGTAFEMAKTTPEWSYVAPDYDVLKLEWPAKLPDQSKSLHSGYRWTKDPKNPESKIVAIDGFHAATAGEYLGGLVWYEFFFGKDAREVPYAPKYLDGKKGKALREAAHEAIAQSGELAVRP